MKILHTVQRYYPDSGGSEEVVRKLSECLAEWGHDVTVATSHTSERKELLLNGVTIKEFDLAGNSVDGIRGDSSEFVNFIRTGEFDIIMNYAAQIWSTDIVFPELRSLRAKKVLVPCGYSQLRNPRFGGYFSSLPDILRQYDSLVYLSPNYIDTKFGEDHGLTNGIVIPNAADEQEFLNAQKNEFRKVRGIGNRTLIINVSNHSNLKGHEFFWNCIGTFDQGKIASALIGNSYFTGPKKWLKECYTECKITAWKRNGILLENLPRRDVINAYTDADIFLFGSQVECSPLVMFESFASKTLFVTTDCGNVSDYSDIVCIVRNEKEAVDVIHDFIGNRAKYQARIEKGYSLFLEKLNWRAIAKQYEELYASLLHGSHLERRIESK
jgi:glycosyltransferase involved in cell wall biosynthesis